MLFGYGVTFQNLDKTNIEKFGPLGLSLLTVQFSQKSAKIHTGFIHHNLFLIVFGLTLIILLAFSCHILNEIFFCPIFNLFVLSYVVLFCIS